MAAASANPKSQDKKHVSRASSTSKIDENPDANSNEPAFVKELQKSLRNAVKKLNGTVKIDTIVAENQGKSLDDLVEEKKINADQKAQALKKPALQAQIAQLEEQISNYKGVAAQYEERLASEKAALKKAHLAELDAVRGNVVADATESSSKALREQLLTVTRFLCAAANLRHSGDTESPLSGAFEAVLFQVYAGNQPAVNSLLKLIEGAQEKVSDADGQTLEFTYADVKQSCNQFAPADDIPQPTSETAPASDPTVANAALTELGDTSVDAVPAGQNTFAETNQLAPPSQTLVSDAANPVAETNYDVNAPTDTLTEVPRDPAETDTGLEATPANVDADVKTDEAGAKGTGGRGRGGRGRGRGEGRGRGRGDRRGRGRRGGGRGGRGGGNGSPAPPTPAE